MDNYIRFDWAMKRLPRDKANHEVLEGLLEPLLGEKYGLTVKGSSQRHLRHPVPDP